MMSWSFGRIGGEERGKQRLGEERRGENGGNQRSFFQEEILGDPREGYVA